MTDQMYFEDVEEGQELEIDLHEASAGDEIVFDRVLAISGDDGVQLGKPTLDGASVKQWEGLVGVLSQGDDELVEALMPITRQQLIEAHRARVIIELLTQQGDEDETRLLRDQLELAIDSARQSAVRLLGQLGDVDVVADLMERMGNRVYGCDDCLAVCPWNKFSGPTREPAFFPRPELTAPRLADLATLDDAGFRRVFGGSAIKRTGRDRFVRNVLIAIGNSGDAALKPYAEGLMDDPSTIVATAARWAVERLGALDG